MKPMTKNLAFLSLLILTAALFAPEAPAQIQIGATAPNFTKNEVTSGGIGGLISLEDYADKDVVVLFILGYG